VEREGGKKSCFVFIQKYYGRKSPTGRDVCRLRKAYYNARHEASAQIDEIVGETASEADSSETSVCEKENGHEKDEDVIRCICGLYKDEGLMIQCEKCMVRQGEREAEPGALFLFSITSGAFTSSFPVAVGFVTSSDLRFLSQRREGFCLRRGNATCVSIQSSWHFAETARNSCR